MVENEIKLRLEESIGGPKKQVWRLNNGENWPTEWKHLKRHRMFGSSATFERQEETDSR